MASNNKSPPSPSNSKSYTDWLKLIEIWRKFTSLEPEKQGPAIVLSLEGEAQDAILELDTNDITDKDGVDKVIKRLNHLYKKGELTEKYNALESFETYKQKSNTSIHDFLTEFEKQYNKTKSHGTIWSDDLLAYRLLKSANLTTRDEQLVKATIGELKYETVKIKLTKIFSDTNEVPTADLNNLNIKSEPTYLAQNLSTEQTSACNPDYEEQFDHPSQEFLQETSYDSDYCDTYFNRNKENKYNRKSKTYPNTNPRQLQRPFTQQLPQKPNWRTHKQENIRKLSIK